MMSRVLAPAAPGLHPPIPLTLPPPPAALRSTCSISGTREVASGLRAAGPQDAPRLPRGANSKFAGAGASPPRAPWLAPSVCPQPPLLSQDPPAACGRENSVRCLPPPGSRPTSAPTGSQPPQPRAPLHSPARARAAILALTARPGPPSSAAAGRHGPGRRQQRRDHAHSHAHVRGHAPWLFGVSGAGIEERACWPSSVPLRHMALRGRQKLLSGRAFHLPQPSRPGRISPVLTTGLWDAKYSTGVRSHRAPRFSATHTSSNRQAATRA